MSVFDSMSKTKRIAADPLTDHKLPHPKSLSWTAVDAPTALTGVTGSHCELVHGDRSHVIKGNHVETVTANHTHKINGNQNIQIGANHKETIVGKCYQNIIGPQNVTNHNTRHETALGAFTKVYGDFFFHDDHDGQMVTSGFHGEADALSVTLYGLDVEMYGLAIYYTHVADFALTGVHTEVMAQSNQIHNVDLSAWNIKSENGVVTNRNTAAQANVAPTANAAPNLHLPSSVL